MAKQQDPIAAVYKQFIESTVANFSKLPSSDDAKKQAGIVQKIGVAHYRSKLEKCEADLKQLLMVPIEHRPPVLQTLVTHLHQNLCHVFILLEQGVEPGSPEHQRAQQLYIDCHIFALHLFHREEIAVGSYIIRRADNLQQRPRNPSGFGLSHVMEGLDCAMARIGIHILDYVKEHGVQKKFHGEMSYVKTMMFTLIKAKHYLSKAMKREVVSNPDLTVRRLKEVSRNRYDREDKELAEERINLAYLDIESESIREAEENLQWVLYRAIDPPPLALLRANIGMGLRHLGQLENDFKVKKLGKKQILPNPNMVAFTYTLDYVTKSSAAFACIDVADLSKADRYHLFEICCQFQDCIRRLFAVASERDGVYLKTIIRRAHNTDAAYQVEVFKHQIGFVDYLMSLLDIMSNSHKKLQALGGDFISCHVEGTTFADNIKAAESELIMYKLDAENLWRLHGGFEAIYNDEQEKLKKQFDEHEAHFQKMMDAHHKSEKERFLRKKDKEEKKRREGMSWADIVEEGEEEERNPQPKPEPTHPLDRFTLEYVREDYIRAFAELTALQWQFEKEDKHDDQVRALMAIGEFKVDQAMCYEKIYRTGKARYELLSPHQFLTLKSTYDEALACFYQLTEYVENEKKKRTSEQTLEDIDTKLVRLSWCIDEAKKSTERLSQITFDGIERGKQISKEAAQRRREEGEKAPDKPSRKAQERHESERIYCQLVHATYQGLLDVSKRVSVLCTSVQPRSVLQDCDASQSQLLERQYQC